MKSFSGKLLLPLTFLIACLSSLGGLNIIDSAEISNNPLEVKNGQINVDKLLLIIRLIRERLPLNVDDVIKAYEQYTNLHKTQSELARQYKTLPGSGELDLLDKGGEGVDVALNKQQGTTDRKYDEISSILNMKELKIISMNLFEVFGGDEQKSIKGTKYSPKLVTKLKKAIEDLQ